MRRHLTVGQRAMLAEKLANLPVGRPNGNNDDRHHYSRNEASKTVGSFPAAISRIKTVREFAPEEARKVETGEQTLDAAYKVAAKNKKESLGKETPEKAATPKQSMLTLTGIVDKKVEIPYPMPQGRHQFNRTNSISLDAA
jgi:hypothetical protein